MPLRPSTLKRRLHGFETFVIMAIATLLILLEPISKFVNWLMRPVVRLLRLDKLEPQLRRLPVWLALPLVVVTAGMFFAIDLAQYPLFGLGYYLLARSWLLGLGVLLLGFTAHAGKWLAFFAANYLLHLYGPKFREIGWMRFVYWCYFTGTRIIKAWLKAKPWYVAVVEYKAAISERYKLWRVKVRLHNRARKAIALRLRNMRVQQGKCIGGPT